MQIWTSDTCIIHWAQNVIPVYTTVQSQKAVSAYFTNKQILPFGFQYINVIVADSTKI